MRLAVGKRIQVGAVAVVATALACGFFAASAPAAQEQITGKLSKPGYTVIALADTGKARTDRAPNGKFKVRPPKEKVTLHLRAKDGSYAGPIVVGERQGGVRAVVGVRAGADLGLLRVHRKKGYAEVTRRPADDEIVPKRLAKAKMGVPIGAQKFGRVKVKKLDGPAADLDLDGVPDPLDIDDDGDLVLDNSDSNPGTRGRRPTAGFAGQAVTDQFLPQSNLTLYLDQTANANATGLSETQAEAALASQGRLNLGIIPGDVSELDCGGTTSPSPPPPLAGGLSYCSSGGSGLAWRATGLPAPDHFAYLPFPDCCDGDGDGYGELFATSNDPNPGAGQLVMTLSHGAATAQIGTGDVLIQRVTSDGVETEYPATMQYVFATVLALRSFTDGQSPLVTIDYPVASGAAGTRENPFKVAAGAGGDVILTVTLWRPQRRPIPGEDGYSDPPSTWTDIGGLNYSVGIADLGATCPQSAFSENDESLRPMTAGDAFPADYAGLRDLVADALADAQNTLTYSVNITECLEANGIGASFDEAGEQRGLSFNATVPHGTDSAQQPVFFERQ